MLSLLLIQPQPTPALSPADGPSPIDSAVKKLFQFCADPQVGLDAQAVATLIDYVLGPKLKKEADLPKTQKATGAYYDTI